MTGDVTLVDLPGTSGEETPAVFVSSPTAAIKALRAGLAATAARSNGALNIWIDDAGGYRCEAMRDLRSLESKIFYKQSRVIRWFREWWPRIQ